MSKKLFFFVSFVLGLNMVLTNAVNAADPSLVGWWKFDDGFGTKVADSSGYGHHGEFVGSPEWSEGIIGGALKFSQGNYVIIPGYTGVLGTNARTCSAWIKTLVTDGVIFGWGLLSPGTKWIVRVNHLGGGDSELRCEVHNGYHFGTTQINDDEWHHIAVVLEDDGTPDVAETKLYVDGILEISNADIADEPISTIEDMDVTIGQNPHASNRWFDGLLDDARIYNRALTEDEIQAVMTGGGEVSPLALLPDPEDGSIHENTWANLTWRPGDFAVSHDVYIGDNFDDVNAGVEGTFQGNQAGILVTVGLPGFAFPDGLVPGTTYYWRIDEVNEAEPNSPWKGPIWSFSIPPKTAYFPDPADGAESVAVDVQLSWTGGFGSKLHTVYFGDNFDDVNNASGGIPQGSATFTPGTLQMAKTYYWRVDEFDAADTFKGTVWSFLTQGAVGSPSPANGAVDIMQSPVLTWIPGVFADTHQVYFGTDAEAVKNADTSCPEYKGSGSLGSESYDPGQLEWNTTYYWRIDEANNANADSPWIGPLWSFTTANFLVIDDMESYNDLDPADPDSNRIFNAWIDGFDDPTNGSLVGYANPPFAEQSIVHSGNQSMPFEYDNAVGKSEATLTLTSKRDWTVNGVNTLTIWYRGGSSNTAETMYVVLNGSAGVDNDNPDAAQKSFWTQWNIDLQAFADQGVNLTNVNSITFGFGNRNNPVAGGAGMMYFDDIRLYRPSL